MTESTERLSSALADRYRIERRLGEGGMATVYLAEDMKHDRKVAVKVLRPELAAVLGADRFVQEIKTTANLQHPHILPLFDSGEADGFLYYVMPYIEGETLRQKLNRETQLGIGEAVKIATELADALDYAHRQGVIHRDIKPENILLHDGRPMVADFGIALAVSAAAGGRMTETGLSLGTPHYMSPEQATAEKEITGRSDVYSLGSVLYEMLAGDPPHTGSSAQQIVMKIIADEARPVTDLRKSVPPNVAAAVARSLAKLPADRFATAAEFAAGLADPGFMAGSVAAGGLAGGQERRWGSWAPWIVSGLLGGLLAVSWLVMWVGRTAPDVAVVRSSLLPPDGCRFARLGNSNLIRHSPSGEWLVFTAECADAVSMWLLSLESGEYRQLSGTEDGSYPFWSADGQSLGFFAEGRLKRIEVQNGAIRDLAAAPFGRGGAWNQDGDILFAPDLFGGLQRISAEGGTVSTETSPEDAEQVSHRNPQFMPDGRHYVFSVVQADASAPRLVFGELGSGTQRVLLENASNAAYAGSHLVYAIDGVLVARPFSPSTGEFQGQAVSVVPALETWEARALANFSVSPNGTALIYRESIEPRHRSAWLDPVRGTLEPTELDGSNGVALSPNGDFILMTRYTGPGQRYDVWVRDIASGQDTKLSSGPAANWTLAWVFDGTRAAFQEAGETTVLLSTPNRSEGDSLAIDPSGIIGDMWVPGLTFGIGARQVAGTGFDVMRQAFQGGSVVAEVLYATPADEVPTGISADGRWLAYESDRDGRREAYLTRIPGARGHWQVSRNGGRGGRFSRRDMTLYFIDPEGKLMMSRITAGPEPRPSEPRPVPGTPTGVVSFDTAPDGRLFVVYQPDVAATPLRMIQNWMQDLQ